MPVLSLPLTFNNSFWTQDYRKGLETVYAKLSQGIDEDSEVVNFIRARANAERQLAQALMQPRPTGAKGTGMDRDEGASLLVAFRGLQQESQKQGEAHLSVANELDGLVADPFEDWAKQHAARVLDSKRTLLDGYLKNYEEAVVDVSKLKQNYITKARKADEAEDDVKFAPTTDLGKENLTTAPSPASRHTRRGLSISDRITAQIWGTSSPTSTTPSSPTISIHPPEEDRSPIERVSSPLSTSSAKGTEKETIADDSGASSAPRLDKGKGKEGAEPTLVSKSSSPPPLSSPLIQHQPTVVYAGVAFPVNLVPSMFNHAKSELALKTVHIPVLGDYEGFTGEDFVYWLRDNVRGFGGSLDVAEVAARELTERDTLLRRIGELGNKFENSPDALYQFRPKAFELPEPQSPTNTDEDSGLSPTIAQGTSALLKRSGTVASYLAKTLKSTNTTSTEPPYRKARIAADEANEKYRVMVKNLDKLRLNLEERIEATLKQWGRWELDRLRGIKTVLLQYQGSLAQLPGSLAPSLEQSSILLTAFQPEADFTHEIERYRTGPFQPKAHVYESVTHEKALDTFFGIDLGAWAGEGGWNAVRAKDDTSVKEDSKEGAIPLFVTGVLSALKAKYEKLGTAESRKVWIYEVPLAAQHQLREAVNALPSNQPIPAELLDKQDAPVLASTLKLWLLELDPALGTWAGWDDVKNMYPLVGVDAAKETNNVDDLNLVLRRFPQIHLLVLDAIVHHLKQLIDATVTETEPKEVYSTKLALSIGRAILRPQIETALTIQDRHSTVFFVDLLNNYEEVLPQAIAAKKRDSGRAFPPIPVRKRTAPIDMRVNRSNLPGNVDPRTLLEVQLDRQSGGELSRSRTGRLGRPDSPPIDERHSRRASFGFSGNQGVPPQPRSKSPPSTLRDNATSSSIDGALASAPSGQPKEANAPATPVAIPVTSSSGSLPQVSPAAPPLPTGPKPKITSSHSQTSVTPKSGNVVGPPGRPMFKDPPPEDDDLSSGAGPTSAAVIVVPDSTSATPSRSTSNVTGVNEGRSAQQQSTFVPPPPPPPLAQPQLQASAPSPSTYSPRVPSSPPTPSRSPANPPSSSSGRTTPTGGTGAPRSASPVRQASAGSTTPSRSSSLRRESFGPNASTTSLASTATGDSSTSSMTGGAPSGGTRNGPRIMRGPRVAHRPTASMTTSGANSPGGGGTPPNSRPGSGILNPGLKRRPLSGIGFVQKSADSNEDGNNAE